MINEFLSNIQSFFSSEQFILSTATQLFVQLIFILLVIQFSFSVLNSLCSFCKVQYLRFFQSHRHEDLFKAETAFQKNISLLRIFAENLMRLKIIRVRNSDQSNEHSTFGYESFRKEHGNQSKFSEYNVPRDVDNKEENKSV